MVHFAACQKQEHQAVLGWGWGCACCLSVSVTCSSA